MIDNALASWPKDCTAAYICCLSNPQNLNIGALLGARIEDSPFNRVLSSGAVTDFVMLANSNTPIHSRLWCVFEAHKALEQNIRKMKISGDPVDLLTGRAEAVLREQERQAKGHREQEEAVIKQELDDQLKSPELLDNMSTIQLTFGRQLIAFREAAMMSAVVQLEVLGARDADLVNIRSAKCTVEADETRIRAELHGRVEEVEKLVLLLIRDCVCGANWVQPGARVAPGSLKLPLRAKTIDLMAAMNGSSNSLLDVQLACWLRLRPQIRTLTLHGGHLSLAAKDLLRSALIEGLLHDLEQLDVVDDDDGTLIQLNLLAADVKAKQQRLERVHAWRETFAHFVHRSVAGSRWERYHMDVMEATFTHGEFGLRLKHGSGNRAVVIGVDDGSQASAHGVQIYSVILEVAETDVTHLEYEQARHMVIDAERPVKILFGMGGNAVREDQDNVSGEVCSVGAGPYDHARAVVPSHGALPLYACHCTRAVCTGTVPSEDRLASPREAALTVLEDGLNTLEAAETPHDRATLPIWSSAPARTSRISVGQRLSCSDLGAPLEAVSLSPRAPGQDERSTTLAAGAPSASSGRRMCSVRADPFGGMVRVPLNQGAAQASTAEGVDSRSTCLSDVVHKPSRRTLTGRLELQKRALVASSSWGRSKSKRSGLSSRGASERPPNVSTAPDHRMAPRAPKLPIQAQRVQTHVVDCVAAEPRQNSSSSSTVVPSVAHLKQRSLEIQHSNRQLEEQAMMLSGTPRGAAGDTESNVWRLKQRASDIRDANQELSAQAMMLSGTSTRAAGDTESSVWRLKQRASDIRDANQKLSEHAQALTSPESKVHGSGRAPQTVRLHSRAKQSSKSSTGRSGDWI